MDVSDTQASFVIATFGGHKRLAELLQLSLASVYRWNYSREKGGCDGLIPSYLWPDLINLAAKDGIELGADHFMPVHNRQVIAKKRQHSAACKKKSKKIAPKKKTV